MVLQALSLRNKSSCNPFGISEFRFRDGFIIHLGAVQASVVPGKLRTGDLGVIVPPEGLGFVPFKPDVKPALGFNVADEGGIIAIYRVVFIRIKITEDTLGVFFSESLVYILYLRLFRIQVSSQQILPLDLPF